ncbi:hypothetical protein ACFFR3_01310 [Nonomuraea salmonea]|uniref:Uncharacterized protein n=1 Tax=Nonomuraea salmonea TaxID=46181 RepID=A0ABV5NDM4_9ACTN
MTEAPRPGIGRVTAAIVAVAAMLPYLTLKILWLAGHYVGVGAPDLMADLAMVGMNAMTFGMDAVGLVLALAFTMRWGLRLPAWLVLLPLWVGSGLLSVVIVSAPVVLAASGLDALDGGPIEPWVYAMVYGGFIGQGVGLMAAFALYARDRWPAVFTTRLSHPFPSLTRPLQRVIAWAALPVAVLLGGVMLTRVIGAQPYLAVQNLLRGTLAIAGALALVALVRGRGPGRGPGRGAGRGRGPFWRPAVLVWLGSGTLFAWGLYTMVVAAAAGPLSAAEGGVEEFVALFGMLTGLVMGLCAAFLLVERSSVGSGVGDVQAVQQPLEGDDRERDRGAADQRHR